MTAVAIIPARYGSTRFPGKPLASQTGKPLIQHVYESVAAARRIDRVVVATDDDRIADAVRGFGGECMMTSSDHATGTDRVAEAAAKMVVEAIRESQTPLGFGVDLGMGSDPLLGFDLLASEEMVHVPDLIVNVQGDEPEMAPESIDALVELMERRPEAVMGSLACPFKDADDLLNPACVKVVVDKRGDALYFSRSLIPYPRDTGGQAESPEKWLLHLGIYAYRPAFLVRLTSEPPTDLERTEQLEQLRVLFMGERIAIAIVQRESTGIDTPEQYAAFVERYRAVKQSR